VHRSEFFQLQGAWHEAADAANQATEWLAGPRTWDSLGSASVAAQWGAPHPSRRQGDHVRRGLWAGGELGQLSRLCSDLFLWRHVTVQP
jgi:hypothetical protein